MPGSRRFREPRLRKIVSAPQSTAASAAGIQATFICGGLNLDKQMQNEKELIRLASAVGWGGYFVFVWRALT